MRHARAVVIARDNVDLRLVLEPSERFGVKNAVAVTLELRAEGALLHGMTAFRICTARRKRGEECILLRLKPFPNGQGRHLPLT